MKLLTAFGLSERLLSLSFLLRSVIMRHSSATSLNFLVSFNKFRLRVIGLRSGIDKDTSLDFLESKIFSLNFRDRDLIFSNLSCFSYSSLYVSTLFGLFLVFSLDYKWDVVTPTNTFLICYILFYLTGSYAFPLIFNSWAIFPVLSIPSVFLIPSSNLSICSLMLLLENIVLVYYDEMPVF